MDVEKTISEKAISTSSTSQIEIGVVSKGGGVGGTGGVGDEALDRAVDEP
jgi:hypothetical protein